MKYAQISGGIRIEIFHDEYKLLSYIIKKGIKGIDYSTCSERVQYNLDSLMRKNILKRQQGIYSLRNDFKIIQWDKNATFIS